MSFERSAVIAIFAAVTANSAVAAGQPAYVDNDSALAFPSVQYQRTGGKLVAIPAASATATPVKGKQPAVGQVSPDGTQIWSGGDQGWVSRGHAVASSNGQLVHADTLAHDVPKVTLQRGDLQSLQSLAKGG